MLAFREPAAQPAAVQGWLCAAGCVQLAVSSWLHSWLCAALAGEGAREHPRAGARCGRPPAGAGASCPASCTQPAAHNQLHTASCTKASCTKTASCTQPAALLLESIRNSEIMWISHHSLEFSAKFREILIKIGAKFDEKR